MKDSKLKAALRPIVQEHGLGRVLKSLGEIATDDAPRKATQRSAAQSNDRPAKKASPRKPRVTASAYVDKMNIHRDSYPAIAELAKRFENKGFLPSWHDVDNFCRMYEIETPASKSRSNAIPRVFKHLATMDVEEVQKILDYGMFSGPSKLAPISEAIRRYGRAASYRAAASKSSSERVNGDGE